jgi:hypothetical protein
MVKGYFVYAGIVYGKNFHQTQQIFPAHPLAQERTRFSVADLVRSGLVLVWICGVEHLFKLLCALHSE